MSAVFSVWARLTAASRLCALLQDAALLPGPANYAPEASHSLWSPQHEKPHTKLNGSTFTTSKRFDFTSSRDYKHTPGVGTCTALRHNTTVLMTCVMLSGDYTLGSADDATMKRSPRTTFGTVTRDHPFAAKGFYGTTHWRRS